MAKSDKLYADSPTVDRDGEGKVGIKKPIKAVAESTGTDGLPVDVRQANERREMTHRHVTEHLAMHHRQETEHSTESDKKGLHERHLRETEEMHTRHRKEMKALLSRHEKEGLKA